MVTMVIWISGGKGREKEKTKTNLSACVLWTWQSEVVELLFFSSLSSVGPVDSVGRARFYPIS